MRYKQLGIQYLLVHFDVARFQHGVGLTSTVSMPKYSHSRVHAVHAISQRYCDN